MFESHKGGHRPEDRPKTIRELLRRSVPMDFRVGSWPIREGNGQKEKPPRGCFGMALAMFAVGVLAACVILSVAL